MWSPTVWPSLFRPSPLRRASKSSPLLSAKRINVSGMRTPFGPVVIAFPSSVTRRNTASLGRSRPAAMRRRLASLIALIGRLPSGVDRSAWLNLMTPSPDCKAIFSRITPTPISSACDSALSWPCFKPRMPRTTRMNQSHALDGLPPTGAADTCFSIAWNFGLLNASATNSSTFAMPYMPLSFPLLTTCSNSFFICTAAKPRFDRAFNVAACINSWSMLRSLDAGRNSATVSVFGL